MGSQWPGMGKELMQIDAFRDSMKRSDAVLKPLGISVLDLVMNGNDKTFDDVLHSFVSILAIQVRKCSSC